MGDGHGGPLLSGEHLFERYDDSSVNSSRVLSDGAVQLSATMSEDIHDAAVA